MGGIFFGDFVEIVMGQSPPGEMVTYDPVGIPLLNGPTEFGSHHPIPVQYTTNAKKMARIGDILFCVRGSTTGRMNWADRDYAIGRGISAIRHKEDKRLQPFVRAVIEYELSTILAQATGSTFPNVSATQLAGISYPSLEIDEQRTIASILGTLDDKIELNRRMNETLEAMARDIFKEWFVDFGPTRAKMEGREPYLAADLWALFPERLDDEGKPEGWEKVPVGDLAEIVGGSTPSTKAPAYWQDGSHCWATPKDLSNLQSPVLLETERKITDAGISQISSGLLPPGTVLLSSRAPIGYLAITEMPVAINQGFIAMKPKKGCSNLFLWLWASCAHDEIVSRANGSTFLEISKSNFRPITVMTPTAEVFAAFEEIARPLYICLANSERESRTLAQTRDLLLPRLLSGEIRVKDVDKMMEEIS